MVEVKSLRLCSGNVAAMRLAEHRPVLIVIAGPNGLGKTSVASKILHHEWLEDSEYINPDNVARDVFGDWNNHEAILKAANSVEDVDARILFRLSNGEMPKSYANDVPNSAKNIFAKQ